MKYKVLKPFVNLDFRFIDPKATSIFTMDQLTQFDQALVDNGFIEKIEEAPQDFGVIATSKLAGVEIADQDYTEGDKEYFTFDEALEIEKGLKNGWRLPTRHEWVLICEDLALDEHGTLSSQKLRDKLGLSLKGFFDLNDEEVYRLGANAYYWSSVASTTTNGYALYFYATGVYPSNSFSRAVGFPLRFVRDLKEDR